jgi:hypothetical protein
VTGKSPKHGFSSLPEKELGLVQNNSSQTKKADIYLICDAYPDRFLH